MALNTKSLPKAKSSRDGQRKDPPINGDEQAKPGPGYDGPPPNDLGNVLVTFLYNVGQYNVSEAAGFVPDQSKRYVDNGWAVYGDHRDRFVNGEFQGPAHTVETTTTSLSQEPGIGGKRPDAENGNNAGQTRALAPAQDTTSAIVLPGDVRGTYDPQQRRKLAAQISKATSGRATAGEVISYQAMTNENADLILDDYYSVSAAADPKVAEIARDDRGTAEIGVRGL